ncbi:MAG: two-component regulator propeller domain-containing protein, partial [Flavisolibacter sp.]
MGYRYILALSLLLQGLAVNLAAQVMPRLLKKLTIEEGLSNNAVNDIVQDSDGFLWIATSYGLNRFDGTEVVQYYQHDSLNSISDNYVFCLKKLPGNYLAIGTRNGLSFYNLHTGVFKNFYNTGNHALYEFNNTITALELDARGNLWAVSKICIYVFDRSLKLNQVIASPFTEADAVSQRLRFARKIFPLSNGQMLVYLYDGWYVCSSENKKPVRIENSSFRDQFNFLNEMTNPHFVTKSGHYFAEANVFKVFNQFLCISPSEDSLVMFNEKGARMSKCFFPYNKYPFIAWSQQLQIIDSTKLLLLLHDYGLVEITMKWQEGKPCLKNVSPLLFEAYEYGNALRDRQGYWWLATTTDGLQKISPYKEFFKNTSLLNPVSRQAIKHEVVSVERYENSLWTATYGEGFFRTDLLSGLQQQYRFNTNADDPWPNFIWTVRQVSADSLWIGTQEGMFRYCISAKKYLRLPAYPGKPPILDSVPVTTQFVDSRGLVWMGLGRGNGVCYFDSANKNFVYYPGNTEHGYSLRYPTHIREDKQGNLWFTNDASHSLLHWTRNTKHFQIIPLPASVQKKISDLTGLCYESDSVIWVGTVASGLIKFNPLRGTAKIYGHERGLADSRVSDIYEDKAKRLWLTTNGGLSFFDQQTEM